MSCDSTLCGSSQSTDSDNNDHSHRDNRNSKVPLLPIVDTKHVFKMSKQNLFILMLIAFVTGFGFETGTLIPHYLVMFIRHFF